MEAWVSPNASKNRPQNSNKKLIKGTPSQEPSKGGFWEGSGWIWGAFWEGFGGIWEPWGSPNGHETRYSSRKMHVRPPGSLKGGFGEGSGRVRGGLGKVLGWFGEILRCFLIDFNVFLWDFRESSRGRLREYQGNLANPSEPWESE